MMPFPWLSACPRTVCPLCAFFRGPCSGVLERSPYLPGHLHRGSLPEPVSRALPRWASVLQSPVGCRGRDVTDRDDREKVSAQRVWERSWVSEGLETARAKAEPSSLCRETRPRGPPLFLRGTSTPAPPWLLPRRGCRTGREKGRARI